MVVLAAAMIGIAVVFGCFLISAGISEGADEVAEAIRKQSK